MVKTQNTHFGQKRTGQNWPAKHDGQKRTGQNRAGQSRSWPPPFGAPLFVEIEIGRTRKKKLAELIQQYPNSILTRFFRTKDKDFMQVLFGHEVFHNTIGDKSACTISHSFSRVRGLDIRSLLLLVNCDKQSSSSHFFVSFGRTFFWQIRGKMSVSNRPV